MPVSTDKLCFLKSLDFFFSLLCVLQQISISVTFFWIFCKRAAVFFVSFDVLRGKSARADHNLSTCTC